MAGMYPDNKTIELLGEIISWPGVDKDGRFTNGSFSDPLERPSFIPAETINLILDNLSELLVMLDNTKKPNNKDSNQLALALAAALALKAPIASPTFTGTVKVPNKTSAATNDGTLVATEAQVLAAKLNAWAVGAVYMSVVDTSPAELFGGTWTVWGEGRVPVGVASSGTFNAVEKTGGAETHTLTTVQMPKHTHIQNSHTHDTEVHMNDGASSSSGYRGMVMNNVGVWQDLAGYPVRLKTATATNQNTGEGASHNNLQPYITCYMWKRTA